MKKVLTLFLLISFVASALAQTQVELSLGSLFNSNFVNSDNSRIEDSLQKMNKMRTTLGFGLRLKVQMKKDWSFQTGLLYCRYGARFDRENLQFQDSIYPTIGRIEDLSQGATKVVVYKYNFDYFVVPINFLLKLHNKKNKASLNQYLSFGIENNLLVQHNLKLDLVGFDYNGEDLFKIKQTFWQPVKYQLSLKAGARFEIKLNSKARITLQPELRIPLMAATTGSPKITGASLNLWSGLTYSFD